MTKLTKRLLRRLKEAGYEWKGDARIDRTYAGRHQLAAGAWTWILVGDDERSTKIGGCDTVSELVKGEVELHRFYGDNWEVFRKLLPHQRDVVMHAARISNQAVPE